MTCSTFVLPIQSESGPESSPITQMKAVNWHRNQRQGGNRVDIDVASSGAAIGTGRETSMKCDIGSRNVWGRGGLFFRVGFLAQLWLICDSVTEMFKRIWELGSLHYLMPKSFWIFFCFLICLCLLSQEISFIDPAASVPSGLITVSSTWASPLVTERLG